MYSYQRRLAFVLILPGFIVQVLSRVVEDATWPNGLSAVLLIGGTVVLGMGISHAAIAKGRNPHWGWLALLSFLGLLVMALLQDLHPELIAESEGADSEAKEV